MKQEIEKNSCSNNSCYTITALCVSFLTLGLVAGNWIGNCTKKNKCNKVKKCQSYSVDGKVGSTCVWSKTDKKACKKDSVK